ncbi:MAG: CDP-diacylglycerol--serine O-phosphatidyltransferase [Chloroflexi bacterium]|nr:CDP-diacylglycerol--serine O-phosphatidyltransferase [Chloroflexota bacterium]MBP8054210.1 CDP-diacylglycerol--serine O-phosphatidyltransferase [Chloroflexota bacterium]
MNSKYRYLVPNGITFLSLICGIVSILSSATGHLASGGALILASYVLDFFDGTTARKLNARSEFGLQLDSLVDMVSLGAAPAVLAFFHLRLQGDVTESLIWVCAVLLPLAGAFRLARFNLLPMKTGQTDSIGLTISTAGALLVLAVMTDLSGRMVIPNSLFIPLMVILSLLMVSTITFPSLKWIFSRKRLNVCLLILAGIGIWQLSVIPTWYLLTNGYVGLSLARAGYRTVSRQ